MAACRYSSVQSIQLLHTQHWLQHMYVCTLYRYPAKHPQASMEIEGVQVPLLLAGDPAYPLLPWS